MNITINAKSLLVITLATVSSFTAANMEYSKQEIKQLFPHAKESCIESFVSKERRLNERCSREIYRRLIQKEHCENNVDGIFLFDEAERRSYCIIKIITEQPPTKDLRES